MPSIARILVAVALWFTLIGAVEFAGGYVGDLLFKIRAQEALIKNLEATNQHNLQFFRNLPPNCTPLGVMP